MHARVHAHTKISAQLRTRTIGSARRQSFSATACRRSIISSAGELKAAQVSYAVPLYGGRVTCMGLLPENPGVPAGEGPSARSDKVALPVLCLFVHCQ